MPRNNGQAQREKRRLSAQVRAATVQVVVTAGMSAEELRVHNSNTAMEKASHAQGGGHYHPSAEEITEAGLTKLQHVSRWVKDKRGFALRADGKRCPVGAANGCLECYREQTDAVSGQLHRANADLREKRDAEIRRRGLPKPKRPANQRPTG